MYFDPQTDKFPYPLYTDQHYLVVKKDRGIIFDENYPYIDNSASFRFKAFLMRIVLILVVFPIVKIRLGVKTKNRNNIKKYKDILKNGVISIANHVHLWDFLMVSRAIKPFKPKVLVWSKNINGEFGPAMRKVGGIPIPENNLKATMEYYNQVEKYMNDGGWLHIYPEGSMWEYYAPIRPFKRGSFFLATKFNKPVLPIGLSYRQPGWIRKHIFKQIACFNINIGEPIYPDLTIADLRKREGDLMVRAHDALCRLCGINPDKNIYPPIFFNSRRIDYYTSTYGVGYQGSK